MPCFRCLIALLVCAGGQLAAQSIHGVVLDKITQTPLAGATVDLPDITPPYGATCDAGGRFSIPYLAPGRYQVRARYLGYEAAVLPDVLVSNGKDADVQLELEESATAVAMVTITGTKKDKPVNRLAKVSAVALNPESVSRFSGGRSNIARMAANYAGVGATDDYQNQIVVRGNSPVGLLWRLEGIPIPCPGHLSTYGNTGGSFNALNPNILAQSDFLAGAWPAEYGNTTAGVMDINFRSGNKEKYEFMGQLGGWSGVEASAEGPVFRKQNGSFLIGYRYSFVDLFRQLGVKFGGRFVPQYQDLNWKLDFGRNRHQFVFFGLTGNNHILVKGAEIDPDQPFNSPREDSELGGGFLTVGFRHQWLIDSVSYLKTTLAYCGSKLDGQTWNLDSLYRPSPQSDDRNRDGSLRFSVLYQRKFTKQITLRGGMLLQGMQLKTRLLVLDESGMFVPLRDYNGQLGLIEAFAQMQYKVKKRYSVNIGLHSQHLSLTGATSFEPRAALKFKLPQDNDLTFAYGYHAQAAPLQALFFSLPDGSRGNPGLDFIFSHQGVISWVKKWDNDWRSRVEAYYQALSHIPVHRQADGYSLANIGAGFDDGDLSNLESNGAGRNYGLEITLSKSYRSGFYALFTASLFESKYRGSDGVWRNTAFNTRYIVNGLIGKEFPLKKRLVLTFDGKVGTSGGRWYTPILLDQSVAAMQELHDETNPYSMQYPAFFRLDIKAGVRLNLDRATHHLFLDFTNVTNRDNVFAYRYFRGSDRVSTQYQLGITPDFVYRVNF